jgi:CubicO group peptidase (beta-lactamase class C family)
VSERNVEISGDCDHRFLAVKDAFAANFSFHGDVGACVAVIHEDELVVDLWGGHQDSARSVPWQRDTIVNVWSTTKTMANLAALLLASRGELELDVPVADYWPEFADSGKHDVLVRHVLAHTAGLPSWDRVITVDDLYDPVALCSLLARQPTWWEPGTRSGYHTLTQGYLVGEIVRRVTGRTLGRYFADEIALPLGADFHIGLPAEHDDRVALVIPPPPPPSASMTTLDDLATRANNPNLEASESWSVDWRRAEIPAANGHGNARSVAQVQSVVSGGGTARGVELLDERSIARIFDVQSAGRDLVLGVGLTFGIGFGLNSPRKPIAPNPRVCYWGGWGGSLVVNDVDARFTIAYVMNRMGVGTVGDDRAHALLRAIYESLES